MSTIGIFQTVSVLSTGHTRRFNSLNMRGHCTSIIKIIILLSFKRWQMPTTTLLCSILVITDVTVMALFSENLLLVKISRTTVWIYHHPNHFQIRIKSFPSYFWLMKLTHCVKILSLPTHGGHCPIQVAYLMQDFQGLVNRWNVPFGLAKKKFEVLHRPIRCSVERATVIIQASFVLHNFVRQRDGLPLQANTENADNNNITSLGPIAHSGRHSIRAKEVRDGFRNYFMTSEGSVPWVTAKYAV